VNPEDLRDALVHIYEREKQAWVEKHPDATPQEYEQAIRKIAERIGF